MKRADKDQKSKVNRFEMCYSLCTEPTLCEVSTFFSHGYSREEGGVRR